MARASVRVDIDTGDVKAAVGRAVDAVRPPVVTEAVLAGARRYQQGIRGRAPRRSGRLVGSFDVRTTGAYSAAVSSDLIYAQVQEFGATITPRTARVLAFNPGSGFVFARRVRVPAQPYFLPTFEADTDAAAAAVMDVIGDHIGI